MTFSFKKDLLSIVFFVVSIGVNIIAEAKLVAVINKQTRIKNDFNGTIRNFNL